MATQDLLQFLERYAREKEEAGDRKTADILRAARHELERYEEEDPLPAIKDRLGPDLFSRLQDSREATERALLDPNPKVRDAALSLLFHRWPLSESAARHCLRLATDDPDAEVRTTAFTLLTDCVPVLGLARPAAVLAKVVRSTSESLDLRHNAYLLLLSLLNLLSAREFDPTHFRFPDDVRWDLIDHWTSR